MLLQTSITDKIRLTSTTTANLDVQASYVDYAAGVQTPGRTNSLITSIATTDIVGVPGSSVQRNVRFLSVRNSHASTSNGVTLIHTDGTSAVTLWSGTLAAGESIVFNEGKWQYNDASGKEVSTTETGQLLGSIVLTSGTSFTTGTRTRSIRVRLLGGGGAGGGATSNAANISAAGGGAAGGYGEKAFSVSPNTAYTYQIGAGGAGGINGANAGNTGTNTFFVVGATNVVANGGPGGAAAPAAGATTTRLGGARPTQTASGDLNGSGGAGGNGFSVSTTIASSGAGADSIYGGGGPPINTNGNGANAVNFGAGGAGALTVGAANATGGNGSQGVIIVDEYS